jgi:hypothetical protein
VKSILKRWGIIFCLLLFPTISHGGILFQESFEDANLAGRGWYDGVPTGVIDNTEHIPGSTASLKLIWEKSAILPTSGNGYYSMRHKFAATESVYVSYWIKHSANWCGEVYAEGPHVMELFTDVDGDYVTPAHNHLSFYIEEWCSAYNTPSGTCTGQIRTMTQDSDNIDTGNINVDLTNITENRATAGCNGDSDGLGGWAQGMLGCYQSGGH